MDIFVCLLIFTDSLLLAIFLPSEARTTCFIPERDSDESEVGFPILPRPDVFDGTSIGKALALQILQHGRTHSDHAAVSDGDAVSHVCSEADGRKLSDGDATSDGRCPGVRSARMSMKRSNT